MIDMSLKESLLYENVQQGVNSSLSSLNITEKDVEFIKSLLNGYRNGSIVLENFIVNLAQIDAEPETDPISVIILITIFYAFIFIVGILGNVMTCVIIYKNKHMHTATNYYLFNLAVSDFLLLVTGLPLDLYNIWYPNWFPFNETTCICQGLLLETVTNVTILTITSFSVERFIAICHPFRSHAMSTLSRAIKFIVGIWITGFCLAAPQSFEFGIVEEHRQRLCTISITKIGGYFFEISSFLFFIGPLFVISILYMLIGRKLKSSSIFEGIHQSDTDSGRNSIKAQKRVIRMLIAVVVAFFVCWFPFHAQRLMAIYGKTMREKQEIELNPLFIKTYVILTYTSGVLYFMSTCINPLLYNIMSRKFRAASKKTLRPCCGNDNERNSASNNNYNPVSLHPNNIFNSKKNTFDKSSRRLTIPFMKQDSSSSVITQFTLNLNTPPIEQQFVLSSNRSSPPLFNFMNESRRNSSPPKFVLNMQQRQGNGNSGISGAMAIEKNDDLPDCNVNYQRCTKFKVNVNSSLHESEEDKYLS